MAGGGAAGAGFRASFGTISITISLVDRLTGRLTRLGGNISKTNRRIASSFRAVGTAGLAATMMIVQQMESMTQSAQPVISSISRLNSVMVQQGDVVSEATKTTGEWLDIIMDISKSTGAAVQDISNALWQVASAGVKAEDEMKAVAESAARLSQQFQVDTREAIDVLVRSIRGFGMNMEDVTKVSGVFNQAISNSTLTLHDLAKTMSYAAPVAGAMRLEVEDITAAIGAMAQAGVVGSKAGTALRTAITRMSAPTAAARDWMQKLNISFFEVPEAGRKARESWEESQETLDDLQREYRETENRVESLQEAEEEYSQRAQEVSHRIQAIRLKAQKQDRKLTSDELDRIEELKEQRDILQWQAEDRALAEQELRDRMEENKEQQQKVTEQAKAQWQQYQQLKGEMKPMVEIVRMLSDRVEDLTQKEMMTFLKELIGRRGLTGFLAMMSAVGGKTEQVSDALAKQGKVMQESSGFLGELYSKLQETASAQVGMFEMTEIGKNMWEGYRETGQVVIDLQHLMNKELAYSTTLVSEHSEAVLSAKEDITEMRMEMEKWSMAGSQAIKWLGGLKRVGLGLGALSTVIPVIWTMVASLHAIDIGAKLAATGLSTLQASALGVVGVFGSLIFLYKALTTENEKLIPVFASLSGIIAMLTAQLTGFTTQLSSAGIYGIIITLVPLVIRFRDNLKLFIPLMGALSVAIGVVTAALWGLSSVPVVAAISAAIFAVSTLINILVGHSLIDAINIIVGALKGLGKIFMFVFNAIKDVVLGIIDWLINNWKKVLISILFPPAIIGILINELFPGLVDDIIGAISSLPGKILDIAEQIPQKIWEGIKNLTGWLIDKLAGFAGDIVSALNPMNWDWGSPPSAVGEKMMTEIGRGIEEFRPPVLNVATRTANNLREGVTNSLVPKGGVRRNGRTRNEEIDRSISVEVQTGDITEKADEDRLAQKISRQINNGLTRRGVK